MEMHKCVNVSGHKRTEAVVIIKKIKTKKLRKVPVRRLPLTLSGCFYTFTKAHELLCI